MMMNRRRVEFAGFVLVVVALLPSGASFAKEVVEITISGPGLTDAVVLKEADQLAQFQELDFGRMLNEPPAELDEAYFEVHLAIGDGSQVVATNVYHYVPAINSDHGYMYYADVIGGSSTAEGKWFELDDAADRDLRRILREAGMRFGAISSADCAEGETA